MSETQPPTSTADEIGPDPSGESYLTPFRTTIFYHTASIFETAVAVLSVQAQWMPINDDSLVDYGHIADTPAHPAPEIILFGDAASQAEILKFFDRHAKVVRIFTYNSDQRQKYCDANGAVFDPRVVCFDLSNLYENILLLNAGAMYAIEHICCVSFPKYKSITNDPDVTALTGKHLITSIEMGGQSGGAGPATQLFAMCSGIDNFDKITRAIAHGKAVLGTFEYLANKRISRGFLFNLSPFPSSADSTTDTTSTIAPLTAKSYRCWAVQGGDIVPTMIDLAIVHPAVVRTHCALVLFYSSECHSIENTVFPGWRIQLLSGTPGAETLNVCKILEPFATGDVVGTFSLAMAWVSVEKAQKLLPFIYKN
jgi:hypothetical protein